ncbi:MAG: CRISPR-associated protein Csx16 [Proteobacteria bacterium]|nr:CRISPR-associated protein Csx16 [Pseudomonadota bacterium]
MTTYLVTRHEGTCRWVEVMAEDDKLPFPIDQAIEHLELDSLHKGDIVVGTLPIHVAAQLHERGVKFWALDIDTPPELRGSELGPAELHLCGARLTRYEIEKVECETVEARRAREQAPPQPSATLIPVSEQLAPAAIGWLHDPTVQVRLLATPTMKGYAETLKHWFLARPAAPRVGIVDWDDSDYQHLLTQAESWASRLVPEARSRVVINLTGGTKPMAMALQRAFGKRAEAFHGRLRGPYVNTQQQSIDELLAPELGPTKLRSVLNLGDVLALHGFTAAHAMSANEGYARWLQRKQLFELLLPCPCWLGSWYRALSDACWLMNPRKNLHMQAHSRDSRDCQVNWNGTADAPQFVVRFKLAKVFKDVQKALHSPFGEAIRECGLTKYSLRETDQTLTFNLLANPEDELAFLSGGWMEVWLASMFERSGVDDWAQGITVERDGVSNEFDLVAVNGNRSLIVEVKTANLLIDGQETSKATDIVYKLDALAEKMGHHFNDRWLVSLRPLSQADLNRAHKHKIRVFQGGGGKSNHSSLGLLSKAIDDWVTATRLPRDSELQRFEIPPHSLR